MDAKTDNLGDLDQNEGFVFAPESEVRTLPDHNISFVLPANHGQEQFQRTRFTGRVVYMEFALGEENETEELPTKFSIHGQEYKMPKAWQSIHRHGLEMTKRVASSEGVIVLGAEELKAPVTLLLQNVHVNLGKDTRSTEEWTALAQKINDKTGRKLRVIQVPNSNVLVIPASWILQDLTAVAATRQKDPKTAVAEIKVLTYTFPDLGSKLIYIEDGEQRSGQIVDFDIVQGGSRVEVALRNPVEEFDDVETFYFLFSNVYVKIDAKEMAKKLSVEELQKRARNPAIIRVISPQDQAIMKQINREAGVPNYVVEAQKHIFDRLKSWWVWKVESENLKILVSEYPKRNGAKNGEKPKTFWVAPKEAIENPDLNIVSYESGEAQIGEVCYAISHGRRRDQDDCDDVIDIHDLDEKSEVTSLVFNAVIGTAVTGVAGKLVKSFFSTYNGIGISMTSAPLFSSVPSTGRPCVDVKQVSHVIGYQGKGKQNGHEDKIVVYWAPCTQALKDFYVWVMNRGDPNHKSFKGKTISEVRSMFECDLYPNLVDMFNFMVDGVSEKNPTRDSAWTNFFMSKCLYIDPRDVE